MNLAAEDGELFLGDADQDGACGDAVAGLRHEADEATKLSAIHQVRELCLPGNPFCIQNRTQIGWLGGIDLMAALLESPNGDVQRQACLALNEACLKNTANSNQLCHCGAIHAIIEILKSGNPDLQTQALAVLGTSAVNSLEVRFALRECGAIEELVRLLGARTTSVQEWAAYALRKACSRSSNLQLSTSMIEIAKQADAVRELVKMHSLRSKEAVEEAQQTLDYFGVDDAAVKSIREQMEREASTQPLVRLQKLSWVMGAHERLGLESANHGLSMGLVQKVGECIAAAARPAVVFRWETQGLAWVQNLDWQRRAAFAARHEAELTAELNALEKKAETMAGGEMRLRQVEGRLEAMESRLAALARQSGDGIVTEEEVAGV